MNLIVNAIRHLTIWSFVWREPATEHLNECAPKALILIFSLSRNELKAQYSECEKSQVERSSLERSGDGHWCTVAMWAICCVRLFVKILFVFAYEKTSQEKYPIIFQINFFSHLNACARWSDAVWCDNRKYQTIACLCWAFRVQYFPENTFYSFHLLRVACSKKMENSFMCEPSSLLKTECAERNICCAIATIQTKRFIHHFGCEKRNQFWMNYSSNQTEKKNIFSFVRISIGV